MRHSAPFFLFLCALALLLAWGCAPAEAPAPQADAPADSSSDPASEGDAPAAGEPVLTVATLSPPVDWLVGRIGGPLVDRQLALPAGEDPQLWQPPAELLVELQSVDLIVASGAGYEVWTSQVSLPLSRLVDAAEGIELIEVAGRTHSHGDAGAHSHGEIDPRVFTDPDLLLAQGRRIHGALVAAAPQAEGDFTAGLEALEADLAAVSAELAEVFAAWPEALPAASSHPSFNYLFRRYGAALKSFDFDPAAAPQAAELEKFRAWAQGAPAVLLWDEEPSEAARAAFGGEGAG
ncbi:MAG: metal ABC transporter substrate-binding protein, partial [Acidobacteriota bacterium]